MTNRALILRNAVANAIRIASSAGTQIVVPFALAIILPRAHYAAWTLCFSLAAYIAYFDIGVPQSTQVLVAGAKLADDPLAMRRVVSASLRLTGVVTGLLLTVAIVVAIGLHAVAPGMPQGLVRDASACLIILVLGQMASLMSVTVTAYFAGLQRNGIPTAVLSPAQFASMVLTLAAALFTDSIPLLAVAYASPLILGCAVITSMCRAEVGQRAASARSEESFGQKFTAFSLLRHSGAMILWSVAAMAVLGCGSLIVGHFAYKDVVPYALASILGSGISGVIGALATPLLPEFVRVLRREPSALGRKIITSTRIHSAGLFTMAAWLLVATPWYSLLLLGRSDSTHTQVWLTQVVMIFGFTIHLAGTPPYLGFLATESHRRMIGLPILQTLVSIGVSLALVSSLGAVGAALGLTAGTLLGVVVICARYVGRARITGLSGRPLSIWLLGAPIVGLAVPIVALCITSGDNIQRTPAGVGLLVVAALLSTIWQLTVVLPPYERQRLSQVMRRRIRLGGQSIPGSSGG